MTPAEIRAKAEELVGRATTAYVADGDRLTGIHVAPSIVDEIASALLSARAEALREVRPLLERAWGLADDVAEEHDDNDYDRPSLTLAERARALSEDVARALATNQEPADE